MDNFKRLLMESEAADYIGLGRTKAREWLKQIGARVTFGRAVRYDREIIDIALSAIQKPKEGRYL